MTLENTTVMRSPSAVSREFEGLHFAYVVNTDWFFLSHRLPLADEARRRGAEVSVIAPETEAAEEIRDRRFGFYPLPIARGSTNPLWDLRTYAALRRYYRTLQPDLLHHVTLKPVVYGSIAARRTGVPAVVNAVSGLGYVFCNGRKRSFTQRTLVRLLRFAVGDGRTHMIFQNGEDRDRFVEEILPGDDRVTLIRGSGVDLEDFPFSVEPAEEPLQVVMPSRLLWSKGVGEFVEAARRIQAQPEMTGRIRFVLAGAPDADSPDSVRKDWLEERVRDGTVEWLGWTEDMPELLARSHLVVLPSYYGEGVSKALIEGAAVGRPLVAADGSGNREVLQDGWNGRLVPPRDAESLAGTILELWRDPNLRKQMGRRGRSLIRTEFRLKDVVERTMECYQRALGASRATKGATSLGGDAVGKPSRAPPSRVLESGT